MWQTEKEWNAGNHACGRQKSGRTQAIMLGGRQKRGEMGIIHACGKRAVEQAIFMLVADKWWNKQYSCFRGQIYFVEVARKGVELNKIAYCWTL